MEPGERVDYDDIVCLDQSFFLNDDYRLTRFEYGSQVLELYCLQSASTDFDLTGQMVWPGAELMNDYLSKHSDMLRDCSVIELGSGVGITGLLCSRFCSEVVLTDHNDEVLKILKRNIELHQSSQDSLCRASLAAEKLEWGSYEHLNGILQRHKEGFDLVLGADICFQQASIPLLYSTITKLLQASRHKNCKFILAYVSRTKLYGFKSLLLGSICLSCIQSFSINYNNSRMDNLVISEASRQGLQISEVAGTRRIVRNLGGVIYEITCG